MLGWALFPMSHRPGLRLLCELGSNLPRLDPEGENRHRAPRCPLPKNTQDVSVVSVTLIVADCLQEGVLSFGYHPLLFLVHVHKS